MKIFPEITAKSIQYKTMWKLLTIILCVLNTCFVHSIHIACINIRTQRAQIGI